MFVGDTKNHLCYGDGLRWTFVNDDSFIWVRLEPDTAHHLRLYQAKMTPGEPLDDEMFINSNFLAKGRYGEQESRPI
jgi:hypothetical protein